MVDIYMVEVEGMDMVEEHPSNYQSAVDSLNRGMMIWERI
jgi:hypothetical protein